LTVTYSVAASSWFFWVGFAERTLPSSF